MKNLRTYAIKYVSRQTGLKPYLIRSWESRYDAVCPQRSASRRRCFTDDDIQRLRLLKQAVGQGHAISAVARLSNDDLGALLREAAGADNGKPDADGPDGQCAEPVVEAARAVASALGHIRQLDPAALEQVLNEASVALSRQFFLQLVVLPLFEKVGELWHSGAIKVVHEHMASLIVRSILWDMLRSIEVSLTAPVIVVATPVGHWHECGALASALTAAESGWRAAYFGPNLPSDELAYAVRRVNAAALGLSLCHRLDDSRLAPDFKQLRRLVGRHLPVFIGGPGGDKLRKLAQETGVIVCGNLTEFRERLEALAGG